MKPDTLRRFPSLAVAFDTETHLIARGLLAPPLVCGSIARQGAAGRLLDKATTREAFDYLTGDRVIVGANVAFDMLVMAADAARRGIDLMPAIFAAYEEGRVFDVQVAEALHAIAEDTLNKDPFTGKNLTDPITGRPARYSLAVCTWLVLGRKDAKENDEWRLRYAELEDVPIEQWPETARIYPVDDAENTLEVALAQTGHVPHIAPHDWVHRSGTDFACSRCSVSLNDRGDSRGCAKTAPRRNLHCHADEVYTSWALHLGAAWGLRTDKAAIDALEAAALKGREAAAPKFKELGFIRADGTENQAKVREAVALAYGSDPLSACSYTFEVDNADGTKRTLGCKDGRIPSTTSKTKGATKTCPACNGTGLEIGPHVPRTDATEKFPFGQIQIGRDTLTESGNETLMAYGQSQEDDKVLDLYVPELRKGQDGAVCLRPNNPLETARVSYTGGPDVFGIPQVMPREVSAHLRIALRELDRTIYPVVPTGVRDCVRARDGMTIYSVDYKGGELVCFAQAAKVRVGFSDMGEALKRGVDVHAALGATMMGVSYELFLEYLDGKHGPVLKKRAKLYRQAAKPENFGNPGGMGAAKKVYQNRKGGPDTPHPNGPSMVDDGSGNLVPGYKGLRFCVLVGGAERCGVKMVYEWKDRPIAPTCLACIETAEAGRDMWFRQWREARPYLDWHSENSENVGEVEQIYSRRIRGGTDYCSEANGDFQALLADIAKAALRRVTKEQYVRTVCTTGAWAGEVSPLFNRSRGSVFAHDELFGEAIREHGHACAMRVTEIMVEEFRKGCPDYAEACDAEPTLMPRWYKQAGPIWHVDAAEQARGFKGRLVEWAPDHNPKTCAECVR